MTGPSLGGAPARSAGRGRAPRSEVLERCAELNKFLDDGIYREAAGAG
eukprot:CAMPEP_0182897440 /NCGR_PEP_ID=MMETSP0034_2-20130328/26896_1 /TAXON_ID=156128 /ORGANISM="Nephroselmis pyriformis, Strain CCMP717" /LENGTH=47 /DNA_ID= /DNA_START= /DNA_END= /DNA_ORIENTATION=